MKGIYALIVNIEKAESVVIGALGEVRFPAGRYVYIGSAQNNIEKRIMRHLSRRKKLRWHIDYLLDDPAVSVTGIYVKTAGREAECAAARALAGAGTPVLNFGSSDCNCKSHLIRIDPVQVLKELGFIRVEVVV